MCIYPPGTGWNHDQPQAYWWFPNPDHHYEFNLHDMYRTYRVFNNGLYLWGCGMLWSEEVSLNTGYNGGGRHFWIASGNSYDVNMTPYNSITMWYIYKPNSATCV